MQQMRNKGAAVAAVLGLGAMLAGCSRDASPAAFASAAQGAPVAVTCEPNQRAIVRQAPVNGVMQSQVQCESVMAAVNYATPVQSPYQTVGYNPGFVPVDANAPTQFVRTAYPAQQVVTRSAAPQRVYRTERVTQPKRSVKKSAVIIGASAGAGAGIGAAVGGKKGAGIGALIGGGGAALWDQITRRK